MRIVPRFVRRASGIAGVERIAFIGSIYTRKQRPKDVDLLVTIREDTDLVALAAAGRSLKGAAQNQNLGADVFLVQDGRYIGRTCSYREPHPRVRCADNRCVPERPHLCDTSAHLVLGDEVIREPPLVLWPEIIVVGPLPPDVGAAFAPLPEERPRDSLGAMDEPMGRGKDP
jgi:hypothetical protein